MWRRRPTGEEERRRLVDLSKKRPLLLSFGRGEKKKATMPQSAAAPATPAAEVSDGKKRALAALDRRFAAAKAELLHEQTRKINKRQKTPKFPTKSEEPRSESNDSLHPMPQSDAPITNRGHLIFSNHTPRFEAHGSTDVEAHPAYSEISQTVHKNLLRDCSEASSKEEVVDKIVYDLLQHGDMSHKYIRGARSLKIDNWFLLDNFVPKKNTSVNARTRALQSHAKRSQRRMSMRQHRKCGSLDLPKEFHNFNLFKPMHEMWRAYIIELLKETGKKQLAQCLLLADLHGAILLVVECKTTSFKGVSGIMIRETTETFGIITQDNLFRVVPKRGSVFILQAGCWKITLHGDKL